VAKTIFAGTVFFCGKKTVFTGHWQKLANPGKCAKTSSAMPTLEMSKMS